ncbi:hypothetical protein M9H77_08331 [Catharanthus roseus]|uniref:Uncharacterized protein n=1 Tax=Catharanthus roseus TaxID=4058 RepID=A0ACC0BXT7_CATRO|nr:hypothetical protein M9H77_08331 [Catharanthus roseus]
MTLLMPVCRNILSKPPISIILLKKLKSTKNPPQLPSPNPATRRCRKRHCRSPAGSPTDADILFFKKKLIGKLWSSYFASCRRSPVVTARIAGMAVKFRSPLAF